MKAPAPLVFFFAAALLAQTAPAVHWQQIESNFLSHPEGQNQREAITLYDWQPPKASLLCPALGTGRITLGTHHPYHLLPAPVRDWLTRLGVVVLEGDRLRCTHALSLACILHQPCREEAFAASERLWYRKDGPPGTAAVLFIPLSRGRINFARQADFSTSGLLTASLPNGFIKRVFPFDPRDSTDWFRTRISGANDRQPFAFASLIFCPQRRQVLVAIEVIPPHGMPLDNIQAIEDLLKRFTNPSHPGWQGSRVTVVQPEPAPQAPSSPRSSAPPPQAPSSPSPSPTSAPTPAEDLARRQQEQRQRNSLAAFACSSPPPLPSELEERFTLPEGTPFLSEDDLAQLIAEVLLEDIETNGDPVLEEIFRDILREPKRPEEPRREERPTWREPEGKPSWPNYEFNEMRPDSRARLAQIERELIPLSCICTTDWIIRSQPYGSRCFDMKVSNLTDLSELSIYPKRLSYAYEDLYVAGQGNSWYQRRHAAFSFQDYSYLRDIYFELPPEGHIHFNDREIGRFFTWPPGRTYWERLPFFDSERQYQRNKELNDERQKLWDRSRKLWKEEADRHNQWIHQRNDRLHQWEAQRDQQVRDWQERQARGQREYREAMERFEREKKAKEGGKERAKQHLDQRAADLLCQTYARAQYCCASLFPLPNFSRPARQPAAGSRPRAPSPPPIDKVLLQWETEIGMNGHNDKFRTVIRRTLRDGLGLSQERSQDWAEKADYGAHRLVIWATWKAVRYKFFQGAALGGAAIALDPGGYYRTLRYTLQPQQIMEWLRSKVGGFFFKELGKFLKRKGKFPEGKWPWDVQ
jgi:hypothetical protein